MSFEEQDNGTAREVPIEEAAGAPAEESATGAPETEGEKDWQEEAKKYFDMCARTQAEMENMKKRLEREKSDFLRFANESLVRELLPVVDNLERAIGAAEAGGESGALLEGVRMTLEGLLAGLDKFGVKPVVAVGESFDPNFHEAVMQQQNSEVENNTVLAEVQKGYLLNDRLVRPAMVIVSKK